MVLPRMLRLSRTRRLVVVVAMGPTRLFLGLVAEEETVIPTKDDITGCGCIEGEEEEKGG